MLFTRCLYKLNCLIKVEEFIENLETVQYGNNNNIYCSAANNLNTCHAMDSLLHIETKKQIFHQTDNTVGLLSQTPLASGPILHQAFGYEFDRSMAIM